MGPRAFDRFVRVTALIVLLVAVLVEAAVIGALVNRIRQLERQAERVSCVSGSRPEGREDSPPASAGGTHFVGGHGGGEGEEGKRG